MAKQHTITTRLDEATLKALDALAARRGMSRFELLRSLVLEAVEPIEATQQATREATFDLILDKLTEIENRLSLVEQERQPSQMLPPSNPSVLEPVLEAQLEPIEATPTNSEASQRSPTSPAQDNTIARRAEQCGLTVEEVRAMFPWLG